MTNEAMLPDSHLAQGAVVVGADATEHTDVAVEWAAQYAAAHRRPLLVVHACGVPTVYQNLTGTGDNRRELRLTGRRTLDRAVALARAREPGLEVRDHLGIGAPEDVLMDSVDGAHLLVLGSRGRGRLTARLLGSVSVGMAAHAPCPVVVVRPEAARDDFSPYAGAWVVGVDGTELSMAALEFAFGLASGEDRPLVVLHAFGTAEERDLIAPDLQRLAAEEHHLMLAETLAGFGEKYPDVAVTEYHTHGEPGHELVRVSESAHGVVVGSHGRGDAASLVLGSVSRQVVEQSKCPVVVVRRAASTAGQGHAHKEES